MALNRYRIVAVFFLIASYTVPSTVCAQELGIGVRDLASDSLFFEARMAFHEMRFESAFDLFTELTAADPGFRLGWGYMAAVDMFLYRDPSTSAGEARKLAEGRSRGERMMTEALLHFAETDFESCLGSLVEVLIDYPDDRFANHLLGIALIGLGRAEEAVEMLRELLRNHPDFHPAWNHLGHAFLETGRMQFARECFRRFMDADELNPGAHDSMADLAVKVGNLDLAVGHLRRAVELEPRMAYAWMYMGDVLVDTGDIDGADQAYRLAVETSLLYGDEFRTLVAEKLAELESDPE